MKIADIRIDGGTQSRDAIQDTIITDYAEAMRNGAVFPAVVVFYDGDVYWLADGFHRRAAALQAGQTDIAVEVRQGTQRDAILHAVGANASHGLRRTTQDKRRAVETLLRDPEWRAWSDREIARQCGVGHQIVGEVRKAIWSSRPDGEDTAPPTERQARRGEQIYTMTVVRPAPTADDEVIAVVDAAGPAAPAPDIAPLTPLPTAPIPLQPLSLVPATPTTMPAQTPLPLPVAPEDPERRYRRLHLLLQIVRHLEQQVQHDLDDLAVERSDETEQPVTGHIQDGLLQQAAHMLQQHPALQAQLDLLLPYLQVTRAG